MATETLLIKDGSSNLTGLAVSSGSFGLVPEHTISGAVNVTASAANPVYVTGSVQISQPVSVDLVVGDNVFVTSSIAAPLYISSSANSPVLVTGTVSTTVVVSDGLRVTSSAAFPVYVSSSDNNPINITGSTASSVFNLSTNPLWVTSSFTNPVYVTSSNGKELFVTNTSATPIHVTSSNAFPLITKNTIATSVTRTGFSTFAASIDWTSTSPSNVSGTFILAAESSTRKGLMFANSTDKNLYVALGDTDYASTNGFLLISTASVPASYSFVLYPSGTYFAEPGFVNVKHSGFFVSSSNISVAITSVTTE